jgi:hypothetical protein
MTYEPKFSWQHTTINEKALPIIIQTINPTIAWFRPVIATTLMEDIKNKIVEELDEVQHICNAATEFAIQAEAAKEKKEVIIPPNYKQFAKVFSEEESKRFPPTREWDHAIDLQPEAPRALPCHIYPMTREEDKALLNFLIEHLEKGYI